MFDTLCLLLPQTVLAVVACLFVLGGTFRISNCTWGPLALLALVAAGGALVYSSHYQTTSPHPELGLVSLSTMSIGFQWCVLGAGALLILMSLNEEASSESAAEFYSLLLLLLAGLMLVSCANELVLLFLGLELISIPTYIVLYLGRRDFPAQEAAVKYFLLSILSAALLLYGFALLYGLTGTTQLGAMREVLASTYRSPAAGIPAQGGSLLGIIALVFIFAGLGFRLTAVPFHFYAPDVYQGTSAFNAGLLAVIPKGAGLIVLIRLASEGLVGFEATGERVALILAAITMTLGNCLALLQTNVRRILAYSSIAHAGYMLIGVAVGFWDLWNPEVSLAAGLALPGGMQASLLYLLAYAVSNLGLFAALIYLAKPGGKQIDHVDDLTGLVKTHPWMAIAMALFLFSLTGIPPLPGFWGKLAVFSSALSVRPPGPGAVHTGFLILAIVGVMNAAIGAVYYLRLVAGMFLNDPITHAKANGGRGPALAVALGTVLLLAMGFAPRPIFKYLDRVSFTSKAPIAAATAPVADVAAK